MNKTRDCPNCDKTTTTLDVCEHCNIDMGKYIKEELDKEQEAIRIAKNYLSDKEDKKQIREEKRQHSYFANHGRR